MLLSNGCRPQQAEDIVASNLTTTLQLRPKILGKEDQGQALLVPKDVSEEQDKQGNTHLLIFSSALKPGEGQH